MSTEIATRTRTSQVYGPGRFLEPSPVRSQGQFAETCRPEVFLHGRSGVVGLKCTSSVGSLQIHVWVAICRKRREFHQVLPTQTRPPHGIRGTAYTSPTCSGQATEKGLTLRCGTIRDWWSPMVLNVSVGQEDPIMIFPRGTSPAVRRLEAVADTADQASRRPATPSRRRGRRRSEKGGKNLA